MAVEAAEVGRQAATTDLSETMVTTQMTVAGSTVGEAMAAATVVGEEAISLGTTPDRFAE